MSRRHNVIVRCPSCKREYSTEVLDSFNVQEEGGIADFLNDSVISHTCTHCGFKAILKAPIMVHNMEKRTMVFFFPGFAGTNESQIAQVKKMIDSDPLMSTYCVRIVENSYSAFKEKTLILEYGYNDIACELYRRSLCKENKQLSQLLFVFDDEQKIRGLIGTGIKGQIKTFAFNSDMYRDYEQIAQAYPAKCPLVLTQEYLSRMEG